MMVTIAASLIVPMVSSLVQPVTPSLINAIAGKGVGRARKREEGGILPLIVLSLMMKAMS